MPVLELLRELALAAPVVLALEDVHWADRSTLDLLTFLVGRLREERLLVVVTYRSDEIDRRQALRGFVAEAARRPRVQRLELARLTPAEALAQLQGILESSPARPFAEAIFARSEGNPLFTEELVSAAARRRRAAARRACATCCWRASTALERRAARTSCAPPPWAAGASIMSCWRAPPASTRRS